MVDDVYDVMLDECEKFGSNYLYEDRILALVGQYGLNLLKKHNLVVENGEFHRRIMYYVKERA